MNTETKSASPNVFTTLVGTKGSLFSALLILIFVLLRFAAFYDYKPLWIDEQISVNAACGDSTLNVYNFEALKEIRFQNLKEPGFLSKVFYANIQNDRSNALLYDYTLSAWMHFFGLSLVSVRALSLLCFLFVLLIALGIAGELQIKPTFFMLLLLSSSLLFRYNMEARTYMFTLCLSLFSTLLLLRYMKNRSFVTLCLYLLFVLLSVFSHYLVVVVFLWQAILVLRLKESNTKFKLLGGYLLVAIVFFSILYLIDQKSDFVNRLSQANTTISQKAPESVHFKPFSLQNLLTGLVQVLSQNFGLSLQSVLQIRFFAVLLLLPAYFIYRQNKNKTLQHGMVFTTLLFTHLTFLVLVSALSGNTTVFQLCYSIFVLPYYLLYFARLSSSPTLKPLEQTMKWSVVLISLLDTAGYIYLA